MTRPGRRRNGNVTVLVNSLALSLHILKDCVCGVDGRVKPGHDKLSICRLSIESGT